MKIIIEGSAEEVLDILSALKPHSEHDIENSSVLYDAIQKGVEKAQKCNNNLSKEELELVFMDKVITALSSIL
ncbi:MAG: hypothetical protein J6K17_14490 [Oscillospiraceae bacterium]|nr:hypothetical protein [Oscillospiraceae bacterium]